MSSILPKSQTCQLATHIFVEMLAFLLGIDRIMLLAMFVIVGIVDFLLGYLFFGSTENRVGVVRQRQLFQLDLTADFISVDNGTPNFLLLLLLFFLYLFLDFHLFRFDAMLNS